MYPLIFTIKFTIRKYLVRSIISAFTSLLLTPSTQFIRKSKQACSCSIVLQFVSIILSLLFPWTAVPLMNISLCCCCCSLHLFRITIGSCRWSKNGLEPSRNRSKQSDGQKEHGCSQMLCATVESPSGYHHIGRLYQWVIDHVNNSIGALHIRTEYRDPSVPPEDLEFCKI